MVARRQATCLRFPVGTDRNGHRATDCGAPLAGNRRTTPTAAETETLWPDTLVAGWAIHLGPGSRHRRSRRSIPNRCAEWQRYAHPLQFDVSRLSATSRVGPGWEGDLLQPCWRTDPAAGSPDRSRKTGLLGDGVRAIAGWAVASVSCRGRGSEILGTQSGFGRRRSGA